MILSARVHSLYSLFQKLDYRDKNDSGKKKLIGIITAYVFSGIILAYNFYISFDPAGFSILAMTSNLFLISILVLTDFGELFLAARSSDLLMSLPLKNADIFLAKFISAVSYLFIFIGCLCIPHTVFYSMYDTGVFNTAMFLLTEILFCYFSAGLLILIYLFALSFFKSKATIILNVLQLLFFVFVFYSSTLSARVTSVRGSTFVKADIMQLQIVNYLPQKLFLLAQSNVYYFIACIILIFVIFVFIYKIISAKYQTMIEIVRDVNVKRKKKRILNISYPGNFIRRLVLRSNYERASFDLIRDLLSNSRFLRVKYVPLVFMPLMFVLIGMLSGIPYLLFFNKDVTGQSFLSTVIPVLSASITMTAMMSTRMLISNTKILDDTSSDTQWIYDILPVSNYSHIISGTIKFIYVYFIIPVMLLITVLLLFKENASTVLLNMLFIISGIFLINSIGVLFDRTMPLTQESNKFNSASKFITIFLSMLLGVILFLIQIFVFQSTIFVLASSLIFIIISALLNRK